MCFICVSAAQSATHPAGNQAHINYGADTKSYEGFGYNSGFKGWFAAPTANVEALLTGPSWSSAPGTAATVTYSFNLTGADDTIVFADDASAFSSAQQLVVKDVFAKIGEFTNVTFTSATSAVDADIFFYVGNLNDSFAGIAGYYFEESSFLQASVGIDTEYADEMSEEGSYDYLTLLHEIGHALGLKHPGDYYGGSEPGPFLSEDLDTIENTVMSYNDNDDDYDTNPDNYQELDIDALQYLYGVAGEGDGDDDDDDDEGVMPPDNGNGAPTNDIVNGTGLGDVLYGGRGQDTLNGGNGDDTIYGGQSIADAYDGNDMMLAGDGRDVVYGNGGNDSISGQDGSDTIYAGWGQDTVVGGVGDDFLAGGGGLAHPADNADTIYGESGNDFIVSNGGNDIVGGGDGNDTIYGGLDNDTINGDSGSDMIYGQFGNDTLIGGAGGDRFFFGVGHGQDTISDFVSGEDKIQLRGNLNGTDINSAVALFFGNYISYSGNNAVIQLSGDSSHQLTVLNIADDGLTAADFEILF